MGRYLIVGRARLAAHKPLAGTDRLSGRHPREEGLSSERRASRCPSAITASFTADGALTPTDDTLTNRDAANFIVIILRVSYDAPRRRHLTMRL